MITCDLCKKEIEPGKQIEFACPEVGIGKQDFHEKCKEDFLAELDVAVGEILS
jgi:predicted RNA-binding Zn-ribbon protein involved in translation (DUF1610 family)